MPSIPQSLLWISLVVLWLFVLVPMLISKRDAVRRTSDVALATRVLNSGTAVRLRRRGPAAGHRSDPDWRPSEDDLDEDIDADVDADLEDARADVRADDGARAPQRSVVKVAAEAAQDEPDYLDVDVVEDSEALPAGRARPVEQPVMAAESDQLAFDDSDDTDESRDADVSDDAGVQAARADSADSGEDDEYEYVDDSSGLEAPSDGDLRIADSISAARRRRHESSTAEAVTARKYRFRARTLSVMGVLLLASAVAAFTWSSTMWWTFGAVATVTLLYLAYLRRQTRIEEQLRRRRAQRIARSRLGVENTADPEFDVTPARLRRPGAAVLEIDDEDPEFEHLEHVAFARHYDLPRAAGQ
ncbi:gephyrin-like molybdotransferase receptor GlpR [Mycolicibacterium sp. S3B2]|uniref:divisome protein SepX/GlpR n=1 Tax=Mycolicibacterium sp. S3B2 TaxID=3415120 RepID=UPI003C7C1298